MKTELLLALTAALLLAVPLARAQVVTTSADSGPGSLRDVVAGSPTGATITFAAGPGQLQALTDGRPVLSKVGNGQFKLTFGVQKATQLTNFVTFPMAAPQATINVQGQLEFLFTSPDSAAFYRLEAR